MPRDATALGAGAVVAVAVFGPVVAVVGAVVAGCVVGAVAGTVAAVALGVSIGEAGTFSSAASDLRICSSVSGCDAAGSVSRVGGSTPFAAAVTAFGGIT